MFVNLLLMLTPFLISDLLGKRKEGHKIYELASTLIYKIIVYSHLLPIAAILLFVGLSLGLTGPVDLRHVYQFALSPFTEPTIVFLITFCMSLVIAYMIARYENVRQYVGFKKSALIKSPALLGGAFVMIAIAHIGSPSSEIVRWTKIYNNLFGVQKLSSLAILGFGIITASFYEEILFRGILYNALKERLNVMLAIVLVVLVFGFGHEIAIYPFVLGLLLTLVYERTGNLFAVIGLHLFNNLISYARFLINNV